MITIADLEKIAKTEPKASEVSQKRREENCIKGQKGKNRQGRPKQLKIF